MSLATRVLLAVALPAIFAAVAILWAASRQQKQPLAAALIQGFGLLCAFTSAQWAVSGWPPFPPVDVTQGIPYLGFLALSAGAAQAGRFRFAWPLVVVVGIASIGFLLRPRIENTWSILESLCWLLVFTMLILLMWWLLGRERASEKRSPQAFLWLIVVGTSAVALVFGHSAMLAQLAGAMAVFIGVLSLLAVVKPAIRLNRGGSAVLVVLLAGLWLSGTLYASVPAASNGLLAAAFLVSTPGALPSGRAGGWKAWVVRGLVVTALAGAALYRTYSLNSVATDEYYYEY